jgi:hypothetical protein
MSLSLFIGCIVVISILITIAIAFILSYANKIEKCRTSKILYCYADDNGWRCTNGTTLKDQLEEYNKNCTPTFCDSLENNPTNLLLPFIDKDITIPLPINENSPFNSLENDRIQDKYDIDKITGATVLSTKNLRIWFCNKDKPLTQKKINLLKDFPGIDDFYSCGPKKFKKA